jgi:putative aldouronate transport system substrate-binding protein
VLKRKGRMVAVLIILCMVISLFAACSNNNSSNEPAANDTAPANEAKNDTNVANDTSTENLDPNSKEAVEVIVADALSKTETPDEFKNTPTFEYTWQIGDAPDGDNTFGQRFFEKKFNVKLKPIKLEGGVRKEQLNLMFATGTIPDLMVVSLADIPEYAKQGLLAEVTEEQVKTNMPGYYSILQKYDPSLINVAKVDGKSMGLPRFYPNGGVPRPAAIRADWLKNVGINKVPQTLDELEAAFIKFRNDDPDKNGKKDTYALSNPSDYPGSAWFQSIFGAYGGNPFTWTEVDGKLQFGLTTNEAKEALLRLAKWHEMELIDPEFITEKGRNTEAEDVAGKFAVGKIGYMDHLSFDDHQWDNDGHLNFKWVQNNPEWLKWMEERKDNPKEYYSTESFKDFNEGVPQPIYINLPPVKGPNGKSGYFRTGFQEAILVFGKQMEKDPEKFNKLLKVLDYINQDEETYFLLDYGPEGTVLSKNAEGELVFNPAWADNELADPKLLKLGGYWTMNPIRWSNPDFLGVIGGPREAQRYKHTADPLKDYDFYEDKLKVTLPSQTQYIEIIDTRVKEYVIKAISGDINIEKTFDKMVKDWYKDGGDVLTKEANEWYDTQK